LFGIWCLEFIISFNKLKVMDEKTFFITKAKLQELKQEHEKLVLAERDKTVGQEAPRILESEDLNPEFVSFQEDIGALRGRIDELENIFENYQLIKKPPKERQVMVDLGAKVGVDINGQHDEFMIMGTLEADPVLGRISNESPVGRALVGRKVGDEVDVFLPEKTTYKIKHISYEIS